MDSLVRVIGPAPSELPLEDLIEKLASERNRVRRSLLWFKTAPEAKARSKKTGKKRPTKRKLSTMAKKEGLSPEQLAAAIAELKRRKRGGK